MNAHAKDLTFRAELAIQEDEPIEAAYLFLRADMWYTTAQTCLRMDELISNTATVPYLKENRHAKKTKEEAQDAPMPGLRLP